MNKKTLRLKLCKMLLRFAQVETDKGILYYEGELVPETEVFIEDENGEMIPAIDGEYTIDGKIIVVVEGKVSEIKDVVVEEMEGEETIEVPETPNYDEAIMLLTNEIEIMKQEIENLKAAIEGIKNAAVETAIEDEYSKQSQKPVWNRL